MPITASPRGSRDAWDYSKHVLIIGATSAIAEATARIYARRGGRLFLMARNRERLEGLAADLRIRGAESVDILVIDANDLQRHEAAVEQAAESLNGIGMALIAHGTLSVQKACEQDVNLTLQEFNTNALSGISLLTHLANRMGSQGRGTIAVITSVAGDRGRQSNYVYGTAKGALSIFLQGLRNRLHPAGVNVLTIKPGFVDTPMTRHFAKGLLWASPERIAEGIVRAVDRHKSVAYLPGYWRLIMLMIRLIPEKLFKSLRL